MLQPEPLSGHYRLVTQPKRQRKDTPTEAIQVEVLVTNAQNIDRMALDIHPGTFVFEILADLCVAHTSSILTVDGRTLALDQRVWYDMTIIVTGTHTHTANGTLNETISSLPVGGLRDLRLDNMAELLMNLHTGEPCYYSSQICYALVSLPKPDFLHERLGSSNASWNHLLCHCHQPPLDSP